jgi:hypothetical protein
MEAGCPPKASETTMDRVCEAETEGCLAAGGTVAGPEDAIVDVEYVDGIMPLSVTASRSPSLLNEIWALTAQRKCRTRDHFEAAASVQMEAG